jgi:hypothetical protein
VCAPPPKGEFALGGIVIPAGMGDCCQVMVLVISHSPGLRPACAQAANATATKQKPVAIQIGNLRMKKSP